MYNPQFLSTFFPQPSSKSTTPRDCPKPTPILFSIILFIFPNLIHPSPLPSTYHPNPVSKNSTSPLPTTPLTAPLTSSASPPGPQTPTPIAPTRAWTSISNTVPTFGLPGNICTVALGLLTSLLLLGRVTHNCIRSTSRRPGRPRISVIQGRIHSRCSGDWIIHTRHSLRRAVVRAMELITRERMCGK